jgi:hypothetical protein
MSYLRLLCASAAMAIAVALFGPFLWGAAPAMAAGPDPAMHHEHHMNGDNGQFVRHDRDDRDRHDRDRDWFRGQPSFGYVQSVNYVQPVVYSYAPAPVVYSTYSTWQAYGPNWYSGLSLTQIVQVCAQYDQSQAMGSASYNPYVQMVCGGVGATVYAPSGFYP